MTQEQVIEDGDPISQEQQALDAQQAGGGETPQYVSLDEMKTLLNSQAQVFREQLSAVTREVRGVQGGMDRGLNALRRDFSQQLEQSKINKVLEQVPEENRSWVEQVLRAAQGRETPQEPQAPAQEPSEVQQAAQVLLAVRQDVQAMGLNPDAPSINYDAILRGDRAAFLKSLGEAAKSPATAPRPAARPTAPGAQPRTVNPQVDTGAVNQRGGYKTIDDVADAIATGKLDPSLPETQALWQRAKDGKL